MMAKMFLRPSSSSRIPSLAGLLVVTLICIQERATSAFVITSNHSPFRHHTSVFLANEENIPNNGDESDDKEFLDKLNSRAEEIEVERERGRLENANTQSFLKRKPRKLPYEDARRWVQANLGPNTKEEFYDLVANGNLRTPYIPKQPEEYYTERREWISWDHFLGGCFDDKTPSAVQPQTGVFD